MNNPKYAKLYEYTMLSRQLVPLCKSTIAKPDINRPVPVSAPNQTVNPLAIITTSVPVLSPQQIVNYYINSQGASVSSSAYTVANTNPTIVIVDANCTGSYGSDLNLFSSYFNIPQMNLNVGTNPTPNGLGTFTILYQSGSGSTTFTKTKPTNIPSNAGWDTEIALDVQYAHTIAPSADIILMLSWSASLTNLGNAVKFANSIVGTTSTLVPSTNIVSLSMSWGATESASTVASLNTAFLSTTGIIYCAASGDTNNTTQLAPAVCTNVIAVGGSSLNISNPTYIESAWNSAGGGISSITPRPLFQNSLNPVPTKRAIPDISGLADPYTGVYVFLNGRMNGIWGGTSLACPIFAATIALLVQTNPSYQNVKVSLNQANLMTLIYNNINTNTKDVTTKSLTVTWTNRYNPITGYDYITGCGSINFANMKAAIASGAISLISIRT